MLLSVGAVAAVAVTHLVDFGVYSLRYRIFNANSAGSWSHLAVTLMLGAGAALCLAGARRTTEQRTALLAPAVVFAILFLLGVSPGVHAAIDSLNHGRLLFAPLLAVVVYCLWRVTRDGEYFSLIRAGAVLLLASYAIHLLEPRGIAGFFGWPVGGWIFQITVVIKEGVELAGVLLGLLALWGTLSAAGHQLPGARGDHKFSRAGDVE